MTLNKNFITIILTGLFSAILLTSCGSHEQKADDAFDRVKKVRMLSNDSNFISDEIIQQSMKTESVKEPENLDEWTRYQNEMEKKIHRNENRIKEIKSLAHADAGLLRKVTSLENDNNDLRIKMVEYHEEMKVKWEMFKASMNHHVTEIEAELNVIKTENKK